MPWDFQNLNPVVEIVQSCPLFLVYSFSQQSDVREFVQLAAFVVPGLEKLPELEAGETEPMKSQAEQSGIVRM